MPRPWQLANLYDHTSPASVNAHTDKSEGTTLDAFEAGYKAGWEDAVSAQRKEQNQISMELGQSLTELSFTFQEARIAALRSIEKVLQSLFKKLLPAIEQEGIAGSIAVEVQRILAENMECKVIIRVSPENCETIERKIPKGVVNLVSAESDEMLGNGQARLEFGNSRIEIELERAIENLLESFSEIFDHSNQEYQYG